MSYFAPRREFLRIFVFSDHVRILDLDGKQRIKHEWRSEDLPPVSRPLLERLVLAVIDSLQDGDPKVKIGITEGHVVLDWHTEEEKAQ